MDCQWHFSMEFHLRDFWCVSVCPSTHVGTCIHTLKHVPASEANRKDPNPKDNSLLRKDTSACEGFRSTCAASFSYRGVVARVRATSFATQRTSDRSSICMIWFNVPDMSMHVGMKATCTRRVTAAQAGANPPASSGGGRRAFTIFQETQEIRY